MDVRVNLPASTSAPPPRPEKTVYLSIKADKQIYIGNDAVTRETLVNALIVQTEGNQ